MGTFCEENVNVLASPEKWCFSELRFRKSISLDSTNFNFQDRDLARTDGRRINRRVGLSGS